MTNKDELGLGELVPALREGSEAATWTEALKLCARAADAISTLIAERDGLREALKPSGETKSAYIGEFTIAVERFVNDDDEPDDEAEGARDPYEHIAVPWTTIKEIMAAISERATLSLTKEGEKP